MARIVIFGTGKIAQIAHHYFSSDSPHTVEGFTCDREFLQGDTFRGLKVVAFDEVVSVFSPQSHWMFVALGYQDLNRLRAERFAAARSLGYQFVSYVSSRSGIAGTRQIGDNCMILESQSIQPFASFGDNVFVWSGCVVGHHSVIGDHCWLTSGAAVGGNTEVGSHCFLGLNSTLGHSIRIGARCLFGANCLVTKDAADDGVYVERDTERQRLSSGQFLELTRLS